MRPEVIVHHLAQARVALTAADQVGIEIQLRSAPGAAASAGVGYLRALGNAAGHELVIDCGDDSGLLMAALRSGCRKLIFDGTTNERNRLGQMAGAAGASLRGLDDPSPPALVLSPEEDGTAVRAWLQAGFQI